MEKSEKKGDVPPPPYSSSSDVESMNKDEKKELPSDLYQRIPVWQDNVFLRTYRRRWLALGVVFIIIVLAIVLGTLHSRGILWAQSSPVVCVQWAPRDPLNPLRGDGIGRFNTGDFDCVAWSDGTTLAPTDAPASTATSDPNVDGGRCLEWKPLPTPTSTVSVDAASLPYSNMYCARWG